MTNIKNRNLVVKDTFDEFVASVNDIDFDVEDIVGYVTNSARVFYWINVESIWGVIGFTWDSLTDNKGYGHFNKTTMPFTIIPRLPDGERITAFNRTFQNIDADTITLTNSNWENLTSLGEAFVPPNKKIIADLTGANILSFTYLGTASGTVYLKGDFSNASYQHLNNIYGSNKNARGLVFEIDDDNKNLNFNYGTSNNEWTILRYKGTGPFKDSYFFKNNNTTANYNSFTTGHNMLSDNYNIEIVNNPGKGCKLGTKQQSNLIIDGTTNEIPMSEEPPVNLTIDCTFNGDVRLAYILKAISPYNEDSFTIDSASITTNAYRYKLNPITFKGEVNSIDFFHPYLYIENSDSFPAYDATLFSKMINKKSAEILLFPIWHRFIKCPYTLDVSHLDYLHIYRSGENFNDSKFKFAENTQTYAEIKEFGEAQGNFIESSGKGFVDVLPNLTGIDKMFERIVLPRCRMGANTGYVIPYSLKCKEFIGMCYYLPKGVFIETSSLTIGWLDYFSSAAEDSASICFKLFPTDGKIIYHSPFGIYNTTPFEKTEDVNYIEFETHDTSILKNSIISHTMGTGAFNATGRYIQDLIIVGQEKINIGSKATKTNLTLDSNFIFIYKSSLYFEVYQDNFTLESFATMANFRRILAGIEPNDTNNTYYISVPTVMYNEITQSEKEYIIQTLNYQLIERKTNV